MLQGFPATDRLAELLSLINSSNATLQWLLLHSAGPQLSKVSAAVAKQSMDKQELCKLLLDTAYLESWVRQRASCQQYVTVSACQCEHAVCHSRSPQYVCFKRDKEDFSNTVFVCQCVSVSHFNIYM